MHCDCSNCSLSLWTASKLEWRILRMPRPGEFQPQLKIEAWCSWRKGSDPSYCQGPGRVKCTEPSQPAMSLITSQSKVSRQSMVFVLFCFLKYDSFNVPDILNIHKMALFQKSFPLWYRFCVHDQRQFSETQPAERTQGKQQLSVIVIKYLSHIGDSSPPFQLLLWAIIWTLSIYRMSYCWGFVQKGLSMRQGSCHAGEGYPGIRRNTRDWAGLRVMAPATSGQHLWLASIGTWAVPQWEGWWD